MRSTTRKFWLTGITGLVLILSLLSSGVGQPVGAMGETQEDPVVEPALLQAFDEKGSAGYLIYFREEPDLSPAHSLAWEERGEFVYQKLSKAAEKSQKDVRAYLDAQGVSYQAFWIDNIIVVQQSSKAVLNGLMQFSEIQSIKAERTLILYEPIEKELEVGPTETRAVESNLTHINVDDVWATGYTGEGMVVGSIDTGVRYTHEALADQYRGSQGAGLTDHNYNWWDPYYGTTAPYDEGSHGSHTVGTMVGFDGGSNQIGLAPDAQWIACLGLPDAGATTAGLLSCAQFMAAPTRLDGTSADPSKRPHVVNNSWGNCDQTYDDWYEGVIDAWLAAGIYPVFANGNAGNCGYSYPPGLNTVGNPARSYHVTGVGSTGKDTGAYADHSNWGPTDSLDTLNPNGYPNLKPQVVAPGVGIRSAYGSSNNAYGIMSGTSMSAPHVSGLIALMWQAAPCLTGDYINTETLIQNSAVPIPYASGNGDEGPGNVPNHATGWGEINAQAAIQDARDYCYDATLDGYVYDASTSQPLEGVWVTAAAQGNPDNDTIGFTNSSGYYNLPAASGETYDITASLYSYLPSTVNNVAVPNPGDVISTNLNLTTRDSVTVTGTVTDGTGHGYPLYAKLVIAAEDHVQTHYTNPFDGTYRVTLYDGVPYDFTISAMVNGYQDALLTDESFAAPSDVADFSLSMDPAMFCSAPGHQSTPGLLEGFETGALPEGWTVTDQAGTGAVWAFDDPGGWGNFTGGTGGFASVDSDYHGFTDVDTALITPSMDFTGEATVTLEFDQFFDAYSGNSYTEVADVDVSINGGASWQNVLSQTSDASGHVILDLSALAGNQPDVRVRFHYYDANFDWFWQIDNVEISPYACIFQPGGVLAGFTTDANTGESLVDVRVESASAGAWSGLTAEDPNLDDGFFWFFQPMAADPESVAFTGSLPEYQHQSHNVTMTADAINRQDFALGTGLLQAAPAPVETSLVLNQTGAASLTLTNAGALDLNFTITEAEGGLQQPGPVSLPAVTDQPRGKNDEHKSISIHADPEAPTAMSSTPEFLPAAGVTAYALDLVYDELVRFDTLTPGAFTSLADLSLSTYAGDFIQDDYDSLYFIDNSDLNLKTIHITTGDIITIGPVNTSPGHTITGMAVDTLGRMFLVSTDIFNAYLYEINPQTGRTIWSAPISGMDCPIDVAISSDLRMYSVDICEDKLFEIDYQSAVATAVGALGTYANYAQGMDFDDSTGTLYWAAYASTDPSTINYSGELRVIDTTSGASALVGAFQNGHAVDNLAIAAHQPADVPWLSESSLSGTIPAGGSVDITLNFDAGLVSTTGVYQATLLIANNTVYRPIYLPVEMQVTSVPKIYLPAIIK